MSALGVCHVFRDWRDGIGGAARKYGWIQTTEFGWEGTEKERGRVERCFSEWEKAE